MVESGKPKPDIYLYAAQQLGLPANECLALEDSPNGVRSASSAGCVTVMVPDLTQPDEELEKLRRIPWRTFLQSSKGRNTYS